MVKVQVNVKIAAKMSAVDNKQLTLVVGDDESVGKLKEKVAASQLVGFPNHSLVFQDQDLDEAKKLSDYGVKEGDSLDFVVQATQENLLDQVADLLVARDLTCDELGLLYCYKHSVSLREALRTVGVEDKFQDWVKEQKGRFCVEKGRVSLVRDGQGAAGGAKLFSPAEEVVQLLKEAGGGPMEVTALCSKFIQKFDVSLSSVVHLRPAEFFDKEKELFTVNGRGMVSLKGKEQQQQQPSMPRPMQSAPKRASRPQHQELLPMMRPLPPARRASSPPAADKPEAVRPAAQKPPTSPRAAAEAATAPSGPHGEEEAVVEQPSPPPSAAALAEKEDSMYHDLHTRVSGRSFNSKVAQALNGVVEVLTERCCLNLARVEKGGSVGRGTAIQGNADAELVLFVNGFLPPAKQGKWLPPLLKCVCGVLSEHYAANPGLGVAEVAVVGDTVRLTAKDCVTVDVKISPVFESYAETLKALVAEQTPEAKKHFQAAFARERTQFVARQTGQVKVTARLLKWWRNQQSWSSEMSRPSDELLELVAIYSALQARPKDQCQAVANAMSLLARFSEVRIVWSNYYKKEEVWAPLLSHRPLLMDPVNPFVNVADPQNFDPRELMTLAKSTHFFY